MLQLLWLFNFWLHGGWLKFKGVFFFFKNLNFLKFPNEFKTIKNVVKNVRKSFPPKKCESAEQKAWNLHLYSWTLALIENKNFKFVAKA